MILAGANVNEISTDINLTFRFDNSKPLEQHLLSGSFWRWEWIRRSSGGTTTPPDTRSATLQAHLVANERSPGDDPPSGAFDKLLTKF